MTGYGRAEGTVGDRQVVAEIRCYNHRYTDIRLKLPRGWMALEVIAEKLIRELVGRGRVECAVRPVSGGYSVGKPVLDRDCALEYLKAYRELAEEMWRETGVQETPDFDLVAKAEGVVVFGETIADSEDERNQVRALLKKALQEVDTMRLAEGAALARQLESLLDSVEEMLASIEVQLPEEQANSIDRLKERIQALTASNEVSQERIAQEVAILAERLDVSEEITRFKSHLAQFRIISARTDQPIGRELDFLLQEMNREINTLLSKLASIALTNLAVSIKAEVEKIREQAQNVE